MSKWLKKFLFGIWGLLLVPLIAPVCKKWLDENVFTDPQDMATTAFRNVTATPAFNHPGLTPEYQRSRCPPD